MSRFLSAHFLGVFAATGPWTVAAFGGRTAGVRREITSCGRAIRDTPGCRSMHRWTSLTFAALVVGSMTVVVVGSRLHARSQPSAKTAASGTPNAAPRNALASDGGAPADKADARETGPFDTLPNGRPVPALPTSAPKLAGFGVILFSYRGAQGAAKDAPEKTEALRRARSVLAEAQLHFDDAVHKGDRGSTADAGHIPRGVLEPAVEYALFSLQKGAVGDTPIDTPRGFWIVRRTD